MELIKKLIERNKKNSTTILLDKLEKLKKLDMTEVNMKHCYAICNILFDRGEVSNYNFFKDLSKKLNIS